MIAGKGNNGNDGRAAAQRLRADGMTVRVFDVATCPARLPPADLVIDAAFGTGFKGTWDAPNVGAAPVLAVDLPSGVDGLTGERRGRSLAADRTVTFAAMKPGLLFGAGRGLAGEVEIADIGLDTSRARAPTSSMPVTCGHGGDRAHRPPTSGHARSGPSPARPGMTGAAHLCSGAAQRAGSGMVTLVVAGHRAGHTRRDRPQTGAWLRLGATRADGSAPVPGAGHRPRPRSRGAHGGGRPGHRCGRAGAGARRRRWPLRARLGPRRSPHRCCAAATTRPC